MFKVSGKVLLAGAVLAFGLGTSVPAAASNVPAPYAAVGSATSVPYGWVDFCRRYAGECVGGASTPLDVNLTPDAMREIARINTWVNETVEPVSDMEHWGVIDQWDIPTDGKGDCEDYALYKRKLLIAEGFPRQALLMTVVKDEHDEGHAVLTVKTNRGEFILDNLHNEIKHWNKTGYHFVKRQSQSDQNVWVQIGDPTAAPAYVSR